MKKETQKVICFFTDTQTFDTLHQLSDKQDISVSQLLRSLVRKFLASDDQRESEQDPGYPNAKTNDSSTFQKFEDTQTPNRKG
jgi:hypothetical protein